VAVEWLAYVSTVIAAHGCIPTNASTIVVVSLAGPPR